MTDITPARGHDARRGARLAAVQALYQMDISGVGVSAIVREYLDHHLAGGDEINPFPQSDRAFFQDIVEGVVAEQALIDAAITHRLAKGWRLDRIDSLVRAAVRAATYELMRCGQVPVNVVLDEYVGIVNAFFDGPEGGFTNALLDRLAKETNSAALRPQALG
ncbi:MAG: hypothetical protein RL186_1489 [Pseudomonadota bacterium]